MCLKIRQLFSVLWYGEPILNQYSRSSKSLISLKNLYLELNAVKIFESPKICMHSAGLLRAAGLRCVGGRGPRGGRALVVYGLVQKSGKMSLLTKLYLEQHTHGSN